MSENSIFIEHELKGARFKLFLVTSCGLKIVNFLSQTINSDRVINELIRCSRAAMQFQKIEM